MKGNAEQLVFFDFEMLCSNRGMAYEKMEAIRLGAVKYDATSREMSYFDQYIKPLNSAPLSAFCKELTGINDSDLADAPYFSAAMDKFFRWVGTLNNTRFLSWSKSDMDRVKLDAELNAYPSGNIARMENGYTDFQAVFTSSVSRTQMSVSNALKLYGFDFTGDPHNPMYDALNTMRIYQCFNEFPVKTDLLMAQQFILGKSVEDIRTVNYLIQNSLRIDLEELFMDKQDIFRLKDAKKLLWKFKKLLGKYKNILLNRSGIFFDGTVSLAQHLFSIYEDMMTSYEHHFNSSSKILILDDATVHHIKSLKVSV